MEETMNSEDGVVCPHCMAVCRFEFTDGDGHLVTHWGDVDHDYECPHCGREFRVRESVTRSYEVIR
jgi:DNA-directed RNA polymerase subunit RPC12/RpoP